MNLRAAWLALAAVGLAVSASAQRNQPIYPAYDGFLANPDGSYTLAFAYFSHNAEPVTIPAGRAEQRSPRRPAIGSSRSRSSRATGVSSA